MEVRFVEIRLTREEFIHFVQLRWSRSHCWETIAAFDDVFIVFDEEEVSPDVLWIVFDVEEALQEECLSELIVQFKDNIAFFIIIPFVLDYCLAIDEVKRVELIVKGAVEYVAMAFVIELWQEDFILLPF